MRVVAMAGLVLGMFAAVAVTGAAQELETPSTYPDVFTFGVNECYFAAVSNGENFGLGAAQTSVTVQNLSERDGAVFLLTGTNGGFAEAQVAPLRAGASKTFSASSLGIQAGATRPVAVLGYTLAAANAEVFTADDEIAIGCVAKQAVAGNNLPSTSSADSAVSGYNATSGREVGFFDELYLPIVQTNCGPGGCWNTILRVANVGPFDNAAVTVRFFPSDDGSGSLNTGFQVQTYLSQGEVMSIDLSDHVAAGWVGSAHVYTDDSVVAIADRYKAGTDMWITNTASNAVAEGQLQVPNGPANMPYVLYAPDVRVDYNGWNTGISVANTVDTDNTVNIQYFGSDGNAPQAQTARVGAHGMTYFYNPSSPSEDSCAQPVNQVATCDFVGGAIILSQKPVAAAVDGVKYFGNDAAVGQAYSYSATGNVFKLQAAPLVQKGSPSTGMGATSGITFLNVNANGTYVITTWLNPSGFSGSNFGPSVVWIPAFATGFVYTMTQSNLPNGFTGSAVVSSDLPIASTTTNVDYAVDGDGTAIWNLYNPCGFYRQLDGCTLPPIVPDPGTKTFSVRPAEANPVYICVIDATEGQGGKPQNPGTECIPNWVFDKGAGEGGQGNADTYVANTVYLWNNTAENFPSTALTGTYLVANVNTFTNTATASLHINGEWSPIAPDQFGFYAWVKWDENLNVATGPSNINTVCSDHNGSWAASGYRLQYFDGASLSGVDLQMLGDLENTVLEIRVGDQTYCGQLEGGSLTHETPEQMAANSAGRFMRVIQTNAQGQASIDLPAGCYFFNVSVEGYATDFSDRECLESGKTLPNNIDLEVAATEDVEVEGLAKTLVFNGEPLSLFLVEFYDAGVDGVCAATPTAAGSDDVLIKSGFARGNGTMTVTFADPDDAPDVYCVAIYNASRTNGLTQGDNFGMLLQYEQIDNPEGVQFQNVTNDLGTVATWVQFNWDTTGMVNPPPFEYHYFIYRGAPQPNPSPTTCQLNPPVTRLVTREIPAPRFLVPAPGQYCFTSYVFTWSGGPRSNAYWDLQRFELTAGDAGTVLKLTPRATFSYQSGTLP